MRVATPSSEPRLEGDINVLPLIDILLVLLVIFMVAQEGRKVLDLHLPAMPDVGSTVQPPPTQIVLQLREDGSYAINGRAVRKAVLGRRLAELYLERPVKMLFVQAAPRRQYEEVIEASDIAKGAGVQLIGFVPYAPPPASR
jgi:biopolymer transport protein ExbD